jgi:hypothetical protein
MIYHPTHEEIITEIESGPLAAQLAPHWNRVFVAPVEAKPLDRTMAKSWEAKTERAGLLHPDAAHAIHKILTTGIPNTRTVPAVPSRAEELEWSFSAKDVKRAKDESVRKLRR